LTVLISNLQDKVPVDDELTGFLDGVVKEALRMAGAAEEAEVSLVFVDDSYMARLNKQYRNMDGPTDVLSFAMQEGQPMPDGGEELVLGDVIISLETAGRQAAEYGHSLLREVAFLTAHGVLHLLGYDHGDAEEAALMREKEKKIMAAFFSEGAGSAE